MADPRKSSHHESGTIFGLPVYTARQMRQTDAAAIKGVGIPGAVLMERAGMAVAEHLLEHFCDHHCFVVLSGKGNNGGDGFVAARHLWESGADVRVFTSAQANEYKGDALVNLRILGKLGIDVFHAPSAAVMKRALSSDCIIVDAVFGTGFSGEPAGKAAELLKAAARSAGINGTPVVAVDIASGVNASTGEASSISLPADATVTFHAPKVGHFVAPGSYLAGDIILADIGIPQELSADADHFLADGEEVALLVPPKMDYDNKFSVGRVLVAGGSTGLTGAACLTSQAALRAGAGVVTAAVPASLNPIFEQKLLEVMTLPLADTGSGHLSEKALERLLAAADGFDCTAIGPGLGRDHESAILVTKFLARSRIPVVLDADGLDAMAGKLASLKRRQAPTVLTPHAGELARLLETTTIYIETHRLASAKAAAKKSGAIVLLKGSSTIITDGNETVLCPSGNPGLATAGAGDVLTGMIAALIAKGLRAFDAAAAAVFLHGLTADLAAEEAGEDNLVSSDLIDYLPLAFASLKAEE